MGISKNILDREDVTTTPIKLKYTYSIQSASIADNGIVVLRGTNGDVSSMGTHVAENTEFLLYRSIRQLYYGEYLSGSLIGSSSAYNDSLQSTAASGTYDYDNRYFPTESSAQITVLKIPKQIYAENVARYSFSLRGTTYNIVDDGNGNLFDITGHALSYYINSGSFNVGYIQERYGNSPTIYTHVGNIIYSQGVAVVTNPNYQNALIPLPPAPSVTPTPTVTLTPTKTITPTPTKTPSISVTPTVTPSVTSTPQNTVTPTPTVTPSITNSVSVTPTQTVSTTVTPTPTVSITITPTVTPSISITPTVTPSMPSLFNMFWTWNNDAAGAGTDFTVVDNLANTLVSENGASNNSKSGTFALDITKSYTFTVTATVPSRWVKLRACNNTNGVELALDGANTDTNTPPQSYQFTINPPYTFSYTVNARGDGNNLTAPIVCPVP